MTSSTFVRVGLRLLLLVPLLEEVIAAGLYTNRIHLRREVQVVQPSSSRIDLNFVLLPSSIPDGYRLERLDLTTEPTEVIRPYKVMLWAEGTRSVTLIVSDDPTGMFWACSQSEAGDRTEKVCGETNEDLYWEDLAAGIAVSISVTGSIDRGQLLQFSDSLRVDPTKPVLDQLVVQQAPFGLPLRYSGVRPDPDPYGDFLIVGPTTYASHADPTWLVLLAPSPRNHKDPPVLLDASLLRDDFDLLSSPSQSWADGLPTTVRGNKGVASFAHTEIDLSSPSDPGQSGQKRSPYTSTRLSWTENGYLMTLNFEVYEALDDREVLARAQSFVSTLEKANRTTLASLPAFRFSGDDSEDEVTREPS